MSKEFLLLFLLSGLAAAATSCLSFPYKNYATDYSYPARPADTLLDQCSSIGLSDPQLCSVTQNSQLTSDQKKHLILNGLVKNNGYAPINEAGSWNDRLSFTAYAPDGVGVYGSTNFQNAWVKVAYVSPSVFDSDKSKLYIGSSGTVRAAYAFTYVVPRQTFQKDCKTDYEVCGYNYQLDLYRNGQKINGGSSSIGYFQNSQTHDAAGSFSASLSMNGQYLIHHYQQVTHCWQIWSSYYCSTSCDYVSTDDKRDQLSISDGFTTYSYAPQPTAKVFVDNFGQGLLDGWLSVDTADYSSIKAYFGTAFLRIQRGDYRLGYSQAPYNVLTPEFSLRPTPIQTNKLSILTVENTTKGLKIHFLAQTDVLDCRIEFNGHFQTQNLTNLCDFNENQTPILNLTLSNVTNGSLTALARFYDNSTGQPLAGKNVSFVYGNQTANSVTDAQGFASTNFFQLSGVSVVSASFLTDFETRSAKATAILPSQGPDFLTLFWQLLALAFAAYLARSWLRGRIS